MPLVEQPFNRIAGSGFDYYFDFSNNSPYTRCNNNVCINESGNYAGFHNPFIFDATSSNFGEQAPVIINYFSSNLDRKSYGENNFISPGNSRVRVLSGFDLSSDFTLAVHAFTSGQGDVVFTNGDNNFIITNERFFSKSDTENLSVALPNPGNETDVLIRRLDNSYTIYGFKEGVSYFEFAPPTIQTPPNNNTLLLPSVSGNLCELFYSSSGWSDTDIDQYINARYSLESHVIQASGYIDANVPYSSGYNEIPLTLIPTNSLKQQFPFFNSLNVPIRIDYNTVENVSGFYLNLETSSDFNFNYSGEFLYSNGNINFLSSIPSGINVQTSIPVYKANNQPLYDYDSSFVFNSKILLGQDGSSYSGIVRLHSLDLNMNSFETTLFLERIVDLFVQSTTFSEKTLDLHVAGGETVFSGLDLFTNGVFGSSDSLDLFVQSNLKGEDSLDLYIMNTFGTVEQINFTTSGENLNTQNSLDFFTKGAFLESSGVDFYTKGTGGNNASLNLFIENSLSDQDNDDSSGPSGPSGVIDRAMNFYIGGVNYSNSVNMFIRGEGKIKESLNLYLKTIDYIGTGADVGTAIVGSTLKVVGAGDGISTAIVGSTFIVGGGGSGSQNNIPNNNINFFMTGTSAKYSESLNLFIARDSEAVDHHLDMYIKVNQGSTDQFNMVTRGSYFEYNTLDLFISGSDTPTGNIDLFTHGF